MTAMMLLCSQVAGCWHHCITVIFIPLANATMAGIDGVAVGGVDAIQCFCCFATLAPTSTQLPIDICLAVQLAGDLIFES